MFLFDCFLVVIFSHVLQEIFREIIVLFSIPDLVIFQGDQVVNT